MKHLGKYTYHQLDISFSYFSTTTNLNNINKYINSLYSIFRNYVKYTIYYNFILHKAFDIKENTLKKKKDYNIFNVDRYLYNTKICPSRDKINANSDFLLFQVTVVLPESVLSEPGRIKK